VLRTNSHSPAMSSSDVGTDGASAFKDSIFDLKQKAEGIVKICHSLITTSFHH
jgi:hypothetical protein